MKALSLTLLILLGISCGGVTLEKKPTQFMGIRTPSPVIQNSEKLTHLKILENKYLQEKRPLKLAITRGLIMEIEGKNMTGPDNSVNDLKKLRKNQTFLSLELTIEHLSHREQIKLGTRHSAFHKRP